MTNDEFSKGLQDDVAKERMRAETKRKEIAQSSEFNMKLLNRKELKKQQDKEDANAYRLNMQRDADALQAIDIAKNQKKRTLMLEVKQTLDEQVKNFNKRKASEKVLSEKEIALNKVPYRLAPSRRRVLSSAPLTRFSDSDTLHFYRIII